jgi:hypothetical protein
MTKGRLGVYLIPFALLSILYSLISTSPSHIPPNFSTSANDTFLTVKATWRETLNDSIFEPSFNQVVVGLRRFQDAQEAYDARPLVDSVGVVHMCGVHSHQSLS